MGASTEGSTDARRCDAGCSRSTAATPSCCMSRARQFNPVS